MPVQPVPRAVGAAMLSVTVLVWTSACASTPPPADLVPGPAPAALSPSPTDVAAPQPANTDAAQPARQATGAGGAGGAALITRALPTIPVRSARLQDGPAAQITPPVELSIPTADIRMPVDAVGVADDGQMEVPARAERAGWYRFGTTPGATSGTAVIAAHVDSVASGLGPFARLVDVAVGDVVEVTGDDGSLHRYAVTERIAIPKSAVPWDDLFTRDGPHRLALVTCGGTWRPEARSYSDNVILLAVPA